MTATYVADRLGISKSTLSNYEKGTRTPNIQMLGKFAEFYGVSLDSLVSREMIKRPSKISFFRRMEEIVTIPILRAITTTDTAATTENTIGYTELRREYKHEKDEYFALYVADDSMRNCRICEGDIVIVRKQTIAENGEIAVVLVEGSNAVIRRVFRADSTVTLMPSGANDVYKAQILDTNIENVTVLGRVVEVKIKL
jgi:repressor LexA